MAGSKPGAPPPSPASILEGLASQALQTTRMARRHSKSLRGENFYADKLAELRADATSAYRQLAARSAGDSSALAELIEAVFSPETPRDRRLEAARELAVSLRTT